jgi:virulence factor Mce-like protein
VIRRHSNNPFTSPVLIGALTVLVLIVATVLAFEANNSLPFVPRYTLHIQTSNAEELVHGSEIHLGGALVGTVTSVAPGRLKDGKPVAIINASLDKSIEPLPVNTHFVIRLKSTIGEKYLAIDPGNSKKTWTNGATVPVRQTSALVDLDQVLDMFTPKTRTGVQITTNTFGQALAGRGPNLNAAIGALAPLVKRLTPVLQNLNASKTNLKGLIQGFNAFTGALAPVSQQDAQLWRGLDTTFRALAGVAEPSLREWIDDTPPTLEQVIKDAPAINPLLVKTAKVFTDLRPGLQTLPSSTPDLVAALRAGITNLPKTAHLDRQLVGLSQSVDQFGHDATVHAGLQRLRVASDSLLKPLRFLTPAQTVCNYPTLLLRNLASAMADQAGTGTMLRVLVLGLDGSLDNFTKPLVNSEVGPSSAPFTSTATFGQIHHGPLHDDPEPNTAAPGQTFECSAGNEPYRFSPSLIGNPSTNVGVKTEKTSVSGG